MSVVNKVLKAADNAISAVEIMSNPARAARKRYGYGHVKQYSDQNLTKQFDAYRDQLSLNPDGVFTPACKGLMNKAPSNATTFSKTKGRDGTEIYAKFAIPAGGTHHTESGLAKSQLETALNRNQPAFLAAKKKYKNAIDHFETLCNEIPTKYRAEAVVLTMNNTIDKAKRALEAQHVVDRENLENLFNKVADPISGAMIDSPFVQNLITLGLVRSDTDANKQTDIDLLKTNMVADLSATQGNELKEFEEETKKAKITLFKSIQKQAEEMAFLVQLAENDKTGAMRQAIEKKANEIEEAKQNASKGAITAHIFPPTKSGHPRFKIAGVQLKDLNEIVAATGSTIKRQEKHKTKDGKQVFLYTMECPRIITSPSRYGSPVQKTVGMMHLIAKAVQRDGFDSIVMNVNFDNPDIARKRSRQAYEACILAGFDPEKITIKQNGKKVEINEIFKGHENELADLHRKYEAASKKPLLEDLKAEQTEVDTVQAALDAHDAATP